VKIVTKPRFVRNHLLAPVFGERSGAGSSAHEVFREVIRLGNSLWLTLLCREIIEIVGSTRRETVCVRLPTKESIVKLWAKQGETVGRSFDSLLDFVSAQQERAREALQQLSVAADEALLGVVLVDVESGKKYGGHDVQGLWGRKGTADLENQVIEAVEELFHGAK
jgi:hypothetical protein